MKLKDVSPATWARTACLILAFINQILAVFGKEALPVLQDDIYQLVSLGATIIIGVIAWWKNNSFTMFAQEADMYMKYLRETDAGVEDALESDGSGDSDGSEESE